MGVLIDGIWHQAEPASKATGGHFIRAGTQFRHWITADGSPGPSGSGGFTAAPGRYHLYVSLACPWAHRTLIARRLKGLDQLISISVTHWLMAENGWTFAPGPGVVADPINNASYVYEIYSAGQPGYTGRVSVPVLWDKETATIVSNESSEIIRMFNRAFDAWGNADLDLYPHQLQPQIEAVNEEIYENLNNGVYRCGFATTQDAYDQAVQKLFACLDRLEQRLSGQRYLAGDRFTEADIRLVTTLLRFDPVYHTHFKCNLHRIKDYPNLWNYMLEIYQFPGIAQTVDMTHIKHHYYTSHESINPTRIVPAGPLIDYTAPHDRDRFAKAA